MFSLFSLEGKSLEPIAILALAGIAGYFLFAHLKAKQAPASAADLTSTGGTPIAQQIANVAMLQSLFGASQTKAPTPGGSPTYTAPTSSSTMGTTTNAGSGA